MLLFILMSAFILSSSGNFKDSAPFEILAPGSYHGREVKSEENGEIWLGMFETNSGYELRSAELVIETVFDPLLDRDDERTGKLIYAADAVIDPYYDMDYQTDRWSIDDADRLMFFLRPLDSVFEEGPVVPVIVDSPHLPPDTVIELGNSGQSLVTVHKGLYLFDGEILQRLTNVYPDSHGEFVSVVWAGDLDGDGKMDLILDDQRHYAYWVYYRLLLSSEAEPGKLVREVAVFVAVSC